MAKGWLSKADVAFFLGFGFDQNNCRRLGLGSNLGQGSSAYYTNFEDILSVEKRARGALRSWAVQDPSHRSVYEAVEKDFNGFDVS